MKRRPKHLLNLTVAIIALGSFTCEANAVILIGGDIPLGTGTLEITEDFTITATSTADISFIAFDNWANNNNVSASDSIIPGSINYSINGGVEQSVAIFQFTDEPFSSFGSIDSSDAYFFLNSSISLNLNDELTIRSGTWGLNTTSADFDIPSGGVFAGNAFIADFSGNQVSSLTPVTVPEPSSALVFGLAALGFLGTRRRIS